MRIPADHLDIILAHPEHPNLVRDTGRTEFRDAQPQIKHIGKGDGGKVGAERRDDDAYLLGEGDVGVGAGSSERAHPAVVDQVGVDDRVEEDGVDCVVQVGIHVVIEPGIAFLAANLSCAAVKIVGCQCTLY